MATVIDDGKPTIGRHRHGPLSSVDAGKLSPCQPSDSRARQVGVRIRPDQRTLAVARNALRPRRSEEHTSELQSLMRISYAVFCLTKKNTKNTETTLRIQIN